MKKIKIITVTSFSVIFFDQLSKYIISNKMYLGQSIKLIGSFLCLTYAKNPNAAFGIPIGSPILMIVLTSVATVLLIFYFFRLKDNGNLIYVGLAMIIGGAIGNLIDRIRMRMVIDFIEIGVKRFKWPIFNIADSFVTIGIIIILFIWIFHKKRDEVVEKLDNQ
ncbi:signal peptidase II [candidate division WOR-3 bacterium]|nr:signal peptidase II [candidate division WOR-3 bacterium]